MADVDINKFRASVVREGSKPASPGFIVSEGQSPTDPAGSGQNHLPVTIAEAATGLSITESQVLGGAGTVGQYIRGDGSLADFPESSGGGSSVSYYLNGSISQGTIGGVAYKELNKVPILGAGTDFTINADGYIASFITDAGDPNLLEIPGGNWNFETYFSASSGGGSPTFYVELYKVNSGGTATLIASNSTFPELIAFGTNIISYFSTLAVPTTALALTDRLAIRYYVTHSGRTITLHTEDNHLCQIITTFTTGLTALNGLTAQIQNFAVGTSGTDFAIASATATHTFNLPTASATNRGALSSADWTTFNNKTSNLGTVTSVGLSSATSGVTIGSTPVTTSGTITLAIATASGSQNGLLSSTDWTTFNSKQNALTNPVTGTGTTNYLPKFTGSTTIGNSQIFDNGTNVGIGTATPTANLEVYNAAQGNIYISSALGNASALRFFSGGNEYVTLRNLANGNFDIETGTGSPATRVRITSGGNVLIGTTTDNGARLQVSGTATVSSSLTANSNIFLANDGTYGSSYITLGFGGTSNGSNRIFAGTSSSVDGIFIAAATGRPISFRAGGGTTDHLTLASTGAASFSNSVVANYGGVFVIPSESPASGSVALVAKTSNGANDIFRWFDGATTLGIFKNNGNVLIGTTTDAGFKLFVNGAAIMGKSGNQALILRNGTTADRFIFYVGDGTSGTVADENYIINNNTDLNILNNGGGVQLVNGATSWTSASDIKLKNINSIIVNAVEKIKTLKAINYSWKSDTKNKENLGLIAQEIKEVFPQIVDERKDGYLGVRYTELIPVLVSAIQELKQEIDTLKK